MFYVLFGNSRFISSKVLRELIKYWRSKSIIIIMYLDDGLGGADTFEKCKEVSLVVKMISLILVLLLPRKSLTGIQYKRVFG
jgi:hypothetical protein